MKPTHSFFFLLAFILLACRGEEPKRMPDTLPDIRGNITNLKKAASKTNNTVAVILVESMEGVEAKHLKASLRIDNHTLIESKTGETLRPENLREGQIIEAWFKDPVMESFPVQAQAAAVRIDK